MLNSLYIGDVALKVWVSYDYSVYSNVEQTLVRDHEYVIHTN